MNPSHSSNNSLFLGDLSKFCTEAELENLFSCCGQILDVKIKRNNNTGKTLSYGFVTFANEEIAAHAMKTMDGTMFYGRKLRIRWAQYNARSHPINEQVINSVYVRFVSPKLDVYITEEDLHNVFDQFGSVVDVSIKESAIDKRTNRQSGYGFVHFSCDKAGVECAFQAVSALDNATVNGVTYYVELSKNLLKQFNEMHGIGAGSAAGASPHSAGMSPMAGGHNISPTASANGGFPQHGRNPSFGYGGSLPRPPSGYDGVSGHYHPQQQQQQQQQQAGPSYHHLLPPQYMHPHAHEYVETDAGHYPTPPPSASNGAAPAGNVPLGYSPKASGYGSQPPVAPRPVRPSHVRDSSLGSLDPAFGQLSVRSYSGSTSPLPHAVSPVASSHGTLTPPHSMAGGSVRSGWSGPGPAMGMNGAAGGSNNNSMHAAHEYGVSPPRSGEEYFLLHQQQQSQMLQAQQLGLQRPGIPRLQINTGAAPPANDFGGVASLQHTTPMNAHKVPFTPSNGSGRQQVPQFAEMLAQELRPYELQQQQQQMYQQGMFPGTNGRSPMNRSVGSATTASTAGGFEEDPERLMGPRSRAGTTNIPPLNLNKSPMAASAGSGYSGMVQKSLTMQQHQMMQQHQQQQNDVRHRRTQTSELHDLGALSFEGLIMTPNGLGSFVELSGEKHGASYSPLPMGLGTSSRSTDSSGSTLTSGVSPTAAVSAVPSLVFDTGSLLSGVVGGALSTASPEEKGNSDGLVSQAIKLLSPPGTPRDYAVLLGVNFL